MAGPFSHDGVPCVPHTLVTSCHWLRRHPMPVTVCICGCLDSSFPRPRLLPKCPLHPPRPHGAPLGGSGPSLAWGRFHCAGFRGAGARLRPGPQRSSSLRDSKPSRVKRLRALRRFRMVLFEPVLNSFRAELTPPWEGNRTRPALRFLEAELPRAGLSVGSRGGDLGLA